MQRLRASALIRIKKVDGEWVLEVLGAPYGGPEGGKDKHGQFFSENTDFMLDIGDERPVLYLHGDTPEGQPMPQPEVIGKATASRRDELGLWFDVVLDKTKEFAERIWEAAKNGLAAASTGTVGYLVRVNQGTGEIRNWPIGELTLLDVGEGRMPANDYATVSLKAVFNEAGLELPEAFLEGDEPKKDAVQEVDFDKQTVHRLLQVREAKRERNR